jgi:hypothetical protein
LRDFEAERPGSFEVDQQLELGRLLDGKTIGPLTVASQAGAVHKSRKLRCCAQSFADDRLCLLVIASGGL